MLLQDIPNWGEHDGDEVDDFDNEEEGEHEEEDDDNDGYLGRR